MSKTEKTTLPFASDGSFFEQFQRTAAAAQIQAAAASLEASRAELLAARKPPLPPDEAKPEPCAALSKAENSYVSDFYPSAAFCGQKQNCIFKSGEKGLGYYKDDGLEGWMKRKQDLAKAKPTGIKANKSMVKLPNRNGAAEPAPKKQKTAEPAEEKPKYLREMEKFKSQSCSGDTKHDRPLVK